MSIGRQWHDFLEDSSMKVLHIYKDYFPVLGGIENHVGLLATGEARHGLDVTVLVTHPGQEADDRMVDGVRLIRARRLTTKASTPLSLSLFRHVAQLPADVTHLHFPYPPGEIASLLLRHGGKTVITYHSDIVRQKSILRLYRPLLTKVLAHANRIIAATPQMVENSPFLRRVSDKCAVIPYGMPLDRLSRADPVQVAALRAQYPGPLLLFVGKLRYYKGVNYLIEAMGNVTATLLIVGSGPMESEWRRQAEESPARARIVFCGEVPDAALPTYYHACDVFALPSSERSEAYGMVQVEAMAAGKPVVCTELGTGTTYVNQDGVTGLVVPPKDPAALSAAINRLLSDEPLRQRMGEAGRARACAEFGEDTMVERVIDVYQSLFMVKS
jgi:glycosyltransferase involved in cell wall biosynthesis